MSRVDWCAKLGWGEEQLRGLSCTGWSYLRQGQFETAQTLYRALAALDAKNPYYFEVLGALALQMGDYQKAVEWLNHALFLDPLHQPSQINKAKALLLLGYRQEGLEVARPLMQSPVQLIADRATALVMAYD